MVDGVVDNVDVVVGMVTVVVVCVDGMRCVGDGVVVVVGCWWYGCCGCCSWCRY